MDKNKVYDDDRSRGRIGDQQEGELASDNGVAYF
jgi:hypothetical protein